MSLDEVLQYLLPTAERNLNITRTDLKQCDPDDEEDWPNSVAGHGLLRIAEAFRRMQEEIKLTGTLEKRAAALIISKNRDITPDELRQHMTGTTFQDLPPTGQACGDIPEDQYPNNVAGYGRLDVAAAYRSASGE